MAQSQRSKNEGASIIFVNPSNEILLFLRDEKPTIPYPNCWDLLGGAVEPGESPRECIIREMQEEIGYKLFDPKLFRVTHFDDRVEYTYVEYADLQIHEVRLNEGQRLKWFSRAEIATLEPNAIAFGFRSILLEFFDVQ
jgi:8-oxo-dGTP diphosphatase